MLSAEDCLPGNFRIKTMKKVICLDSDLREKKDAKRVCQYKKSLAQLLEKRRDTNTQYFSQ